MANQPPGFDEVTTTVMLTLKSMVEAFKNEIPGLKVAYDEKLSYESAVASLRANNNLEGTNSDLYPLFAFRRSVLRYVDPAGPGKRANSIYAKRDMTNLNKPYTSNVYRILHGEFDVNFLYITKDIRALELFEILYMSEEGISNYRELVVDLTDVLGGKFNYYAEYLPLEDKMFELDSVWYKMIQGTVKIKGFYPVFKGESAQILQINAKIASFLGEVYWTKQLNAN